MSKNNSDPGANTPPAEPHVRPLPQNLPYIKALGDAIPILSAVLNSMGDLVHELRLMREPADRRTLDRIGAIGESLARTGQLVKRGFRGG